MFDFMGVIHAFDEFRKAIGKLRYRAPKFPKRMQNVPQPQLEQVAMRTCCRIGGQIGRKR